MRCALAVVAVLAAPMIGLAQPITSEFEVAVLPIAAGEPAGVPLPVVKGESIVERLTFEPSDIPGERFIHPPVLGSQVELDDVIPAAADSEAWAPDAHGLTPGSVSLPAVIRGTN